MPRLLNPVAVAVVLAAILAGCASGTPTDERAGAAAPGGAPGIALAIAPDDAEAVGLAIVELLEDGWDHAPDHPWTGALEELDSAFEEVAPGTAPGQPFEVTATPMAVAALLVSLDREAGFYADAGMPERAEPNALAAAHVRAQLSTVQAAEVLRDETEPLATWGDGG